jgi:hypothetical protein
MNLNQLRGFLVRNRTAVLVAGAGGVAGVALIQRHRANTAPGAGTDSSTVDGTNAADQFADSGYTSSPYDTYDYFQQQLEQLQNQIDNGGSGTTAPVTTPATPRITRPDISNVLAPYWSKRFTANPPTHVQVNPSPVPGHPVLLPHPGTHL